MDLRDLESLLGRWEERGLLSSEQAEAIVAFEVEDAGLDPDALGEDGGFDLGPVLAYGGVFVALLAMVGLHFALVDALEPAARFGIALLAAAGAAALALVLVKAGGTAAADALGFAATLLVAWAVLQGCEFAGLMETDAGDDADSSVRFSVLLSTLVAGGAGWALARAVPAPLAATGASGAFAAAAFTLGWFIGGDDDGGVVGAQVAAVVAFGLAAVTLIPSALGLERRARFCWAIGALIAANVSAFVLAAVEGGVYEGLLLPYAIGVCAAALLAKQRGLLVFAALFLYEYVGFVVFRTFGGAIAAIIVLALIGLGTALGGTLAQRGLGRGALSLRR